MTDFGYGYVCAIGADTRIAAKSRGCRKYDTRPTPCTGCPEQATKVCTHCHDPKCDDCMPTALCCECDSDD